MTEHLIEIAPTCRYCLSNDNVDSLIAPCKCIGTQQYVHTDCLKEWLNKKAQRMVLPFRSNQFRMSCEVCRSPYKLKLGYKDPSCSLPWTICLYILTTTLVLFTTYVVVGMFLQVVAPTLFFSLPTMFENVIANGFVMTHLILGMLYIVVLLTTATNNLFCCMWFNCDDNNTDEGCMVVIVIIVLISIFCTVMLIYMDIVDKVVDRYKMNRTVVIEIYEEKPRK